MTRTHEYAGRVYAIVPDAVLGGAGEHTSCNACAFRNDPDGCIAAGYSCTIPDGHHYVVSPHTGDSAASDHVS
jgi:hypothetical protein